MTNKEKMSKAMEALGDLTPEQKALVKETLEESASEKDMFDKLSKAGIQVEEAKFGAFIKAFAEGREEKVFRQEVSPEELENVAGGNAFSGRDSDQSNCHDDHFRKIYGANGRSFANCAATVGDGSNCWDNDGCKKDAVVYADMKSCSRAWR